ncbi:MAG: ATP-dependent protease, partial [Bacteroidia bacterium]|nr:ATP-dependent protease [Bacteroidia bacterium]
LYAILSGLSRLPIHQGIAVTGSVNQKGEIQPVGAINEKIEGFYEVCLQKGLTGKQGVIIPAANQQRLMLNDDVVQAVKNGDFRIWAIQSIDEGIEILTGVKAGKLLPVTEDGKQSFESGSVYDKVNNRLLQFSDAIHRLRSGKNDS